ncbi:hypothetical protein PHSY_003379 [Pseudozyma hubeiensis SY62]|uniref:Uncharacterized protein n=1 Tax=Pseudozyma hubeiensis (strain SY62) TaxID=1305764 RepID=R9P3H9_PSEHS|nr:hypothetical protein PHSY_003379 [Pseudozyma hubeiensis SY62]GAC95802.1 hypothetical protein PHSY_003379 [Pseudozyma hubeiensis SY62]
MMTNDPRLFSADAVAFAHRSLRESSFTRHVETVRHAFQMQQFTRKHAPADQIAKCDCREKGRKRGWLSLRLARHSAFDEVPPAEPPSLYSHSCRIVHDASHDRTVTSRLAGFSYLSSLKAATALSCGVCAESGIGSVLLVTVEKASGRNDVNSKSSSHSHAGG